MSKFFTLCTGWIAFIALAAAGIAFIPLTLIFMVVFLIMAVEWWRK
jgi:hypothetical protein